MADNFGVLGSSTVLATGTTTAYIVPSNKAAKCKIFASFQGGAGTTLTLLVNNIVVAAIPAMTVNHFTFTSGAAGLLRAPSGTGPTGADAANTVQPAPPIYYLSAGQTVQFIVGATALVNCNVQVVGIEVDLTL